MRKLHCPEDAAWAMSKDSGWTCPSTQNRLLLVKSPSSWESVCACVVRRYSLSLSKGDKYKGVLVPSKMLPPLYPLFSWSSLPCSLCQFKPCLPKVTFLKPSGHLSVWRRKGLVCVFPTLQNCTDDVYFEHRLFFPPRNSLLLLQLKAITSKLGKSSKSKTCDDCVARMPGYPNLFSFSYHTGPASLQRPTYPKAWLF